MPLQLRNFLSCIILGSFISAWNLSCISSSSSHPWNFIFEKIFNNKNILIIGNEKDESYLYLIILSYFIRYGKLDIKNSLLFLETKIKMNYFNFNDALFKFYNEINKLK